MRHDFLLCFVGIEMGYDPWMGSEGRGDCICRWIRQRLSIYKDAILQVCPAPAEETDTKYGANSSQRTIWQAYSWRACPLGREEHLLDLHSAAACPLPDESAG
jgi:hypothetical protein